jgi:hypothetical protein
MHWIQRITARAASVIGTNAIDTGFKHRTDVGFLISGKGN